MEHFKEKQMIKLNKVLYNENNSSSSNSRSSSSKSISNKSKSNKSQKNDYKIKVKR